LSVIETGIVEPAARTRFRASPSPDRRAELLEAARGAFAEAGYEATTVQDVAARAGVAKGTFYIYFDTKLDALLALSAESTQAILGAAIEALEGEPNRREAIAEAVRRLFRVANRYSDVLRFVETGPALTSVRAQTSAIEESHRARLLAWFSAAQRTDAELDPAIAVGLTTAAVNQALKAVFVHQPRVPAAAAARSLTTFLQGALGV
jgi:AcrR family transcriptional regulator